MGVWIVVVVQDRGSGVGVNTVARLEGEREFGAASARPEIEDDAIRKDVVLIDVPTGRGEGGIEGGAINVSTGRKTDFGEKHAVAAEADAPGFDGAMDDIADGGVFLVKGDGKFKGV